MSDEERPVPEQGREQESGAEAPTLREPQPGSEPSGAQPAAEAPPAQQPTVETPAAGQAPAPPPPPPPVVKRPPRTVNAWVAAAVGAVLLVGGGVGGYFIGHANDHGRPGISRFGDRPDFRGPVPGPPNRGDGHRGPFYR